MKACVQFLVSSVVSCVIAAAACADVSDDARRIVESAGVKGGLVVHVNCGDGNLTAALRVGDAYLVQGLDTDLEAVAGTRNAVADKGLYGKVTVREFDGEHLPYIDNLVNLIVVTGETDVSRREMMRVLAPGGVLCMNNERIAKERPEELDEWTHFHHDPQGTMVGRDKVVGPPRRIQWMAGPKWLRNHDFMTVMHAMVTANGRVFYVMDEGLRSHIYLSPRWVLIARDAFNGTLLWKKDLTEWHPTNWPLKSGPGHYPRKLVAVGNRVYVAAGLAEPVVAVDATTGETVRTYEGTRPTQEILLADGVLYLVVDPKARAIDYTAETSNYKEIRRANSGWAWTTESPERVIKAIEADSGRVVWEYEARVAPLTLTLGTGWRRGLRMGISQRRRAIRRLRG